MMPEHRKQMLAALLVLLILAGAFYLRAAGMGWDIPGGFFHPDERGIIMAAERIHFKPVERQPEEGLLAYIRRAAQENLEKDSPLNIRAFHYGTFPYYLLAGTAGVFSDWQKPPSESPGGNWIKALPGCFQVFLVFLVLVLALIYRRRRRNYPLPRAVWYFLGAGCLLWPIITGALHVPGVIERLYDRETASARYLFFLVSLVLSGLPALILLFQTWFSSSLSPKAGLSRLRIIGLLLLGPLAAFLFACGLPTLLERNWIYGNLGYIGRSGSVLFGVGTIALVYAFGSRCYSRRVGFLAALFLTLTVLHIQLCHYSAFDVALAFFIMLALNFFERVQERGTLWAYILSGTAIGAAIACKFSALPLAFLLILPHFVFLLSLRKNQGEASQPVLWPFFRSWLGLALALLFAYGITYALEPFAFIDSETFWRNIEEQRRMVTGQARVPYIIQYEKTTPYFYPLKQMLLRGFGLPLGILILAGWLYTTLKQFRRGDRATLLLLAWTIPLLFVQGRFQVKYPRYLITLVPAWCLLGAVFVEDLLRVGRPGCGPFFLRRWLRQRVLRAVRLSLVFVLIATAIYAFSFIRIYQRPHTWLVASDWIYENVPRGSTILGEHWDDSLPMRLRDRDRGQWGYKVKSLPVYEGDSPNKIRQMCKELAGADYVILATKRGYGSILRVPERYPYTSTYYRALFAGALGYEPVRVFTGAPKVLGLQLSDDRLDESLRVYDHPKAIVFKKTEKLSAEQLESIIFKPPEWITRITYEEILTLQDGLPVYAKHPRYPLLRWYLCLQLIGLIFFPLCFPLTRHLADGGWSLARPMGILLLAYAAWVLSSVRMVPFGGLGIWAVLSAFLIAALFLYRRYGAEMRSSLRGHIGLLIVEELVWLGALALFLAIRMHNPDIYWGEKPMDMSFIASAYRTQWFPPLDAWFSGNVINYYYYGHVVFASLGLLAGVPAHYLYNLAVGTIPALTALAAFGVLYNLTRKYTYGILGAYLMTLAGNLYGYFQMAANLHSEQGLFKVFRLAWSVLRVPFGVDPTLGQQGRSALARHVGFDSYFWKCGHDLIPHTVANEFPMWTFLFADLHAHMIVMPFTLLLIGLAFALFSSPGRALHLRQPQGGGFWSLLLLSITLGTILCVNAWDFPTATLLLLLVLLLKWWKFREDQAEGRAAIYGESLERFRVNRKGLAGLFVFKAEVLLPLAAIILTAILLFMPFHMHFHPRVPLGPGSVLVSLGNMTQVDTYLKIFGVFLFLVGSSLLYRWHTMPGRSPRPSRELWLIGAGAAVGTVSMLAFSLATALGIALALTLLAGMILKALDREHCYWGRWAGAFLLFVGALFTASLIRQSSEGIHQFLVSLAKREWLPPFVELRPHFRDILLDYTTVAVLLPLWVMTLVMLVRGRRSRADSYSLVLAWVGLSVGIGAEILFVKEGWEHPNHRWNTVFKFFLQAWMYLSLAAAAGLYWIRHHRVSVYRGRRNWYLRPLRWLWMVALCLLLAASAMFPIFGTFAVTRGPGARCVKGPRPSIDGLLYLNQGKSRGEFLTIHWLNRFVEGQPLLVEEMGEGYRHESSRISTNTGIPTLIGWEHHVKERSPSGQEEARRHQAEVSQRRKDVQRIYSSNSDKAEVVDLLGRRGVEYLYVGSWERQKYAASVRKFQDYDDVLDLLFHTQGADLYRIRKNFNALYLGEASAEAARTETERQTGTNMYQGGAGYDNGNFREPRGIAFDAQGRAYVADTFNHRIQVFDPKGEFLFLFGEEGEGEGQFKEPNDLLVTPQGELVVLDTWNHRVQVFDLQGNFRYPFGPGFYGPRGIALGPDGHLYITDTGSGMVKVFSLQGQPVRHWGGRGSRPGQLYEPVGIAVSAEGEVFVADTRNFRFVVYDLAGNPRRSWTLEDCGLPESAGEKHLCLTPEGKVLASDPANAQVLVFDPDGRLLETISRQGSIRAPLDFPIGLAIHPLSRDLVLCETRLNRMLRIPASVLH